ncbi:hypothetical protein PAXRUDRAFT_21039 [Paxillus rubicundulus Ve08.2h10]|uniref:Unplaced genomic scaffold scaffold_5102, whole genome shotgun sequence n=1 Tax=Paxillus rubicundulus Ve08.2h10 TaxID=930991 RepID=A0A0D0D0C1_9AGAM|nr:hypothetical protein PAXRUDRAFT_21039 [Paxillus rubicundulus Ve08.2h10]
MPVGRATGKIAPYQVQSPPIAALQPLQPDSINSELYKELGSNARYAYQKVSEQSFSGKRSAESVRSRYERLRKIFSYILAFKSMTGNSTGDPDVEELGEQIKNARVAGKDVGNLSGIMLKRWYTEGWYELLNNHLGEHPGLVWAHNFHSGTISDTIEITSDEDHNNDSDGSESLEVDMKLLKKHTAKATVVSAKQKGKSAVSKGVPVPHHKRQASHTSMGGELTEYLTSNAKYMWYMMKSDQQRMKIQQRHEDRQDEKEEAGVKLALQEAKVKNAREVLKNEKMPDNMKAIAQQVLMDYFANENQ